MKTKAHTQYRVDGKQVPGCTTLTGQLNKPALVPWANRLGLQGIDCSKFRDEKAGIGSLVHSMILADLKGETLDTSDWSKNQIDLADNSILSWLEWRERHKLRPVVIETPLVSAKYMFGGTPDYIGWIDDIFCLGDYKTGAIYEEAIFQTCGYALLWEEYEESAERDGVFPGVAGSLAASGHKTLIEEIVILGIPRSEDEDFMEKHIRNLEPGKEVIKDLAKLYHDRKRMKAK